MSERELVSVIVPTWGRYQLVVETLANIRSQTYPNIEVLIVQDGPEVLAFWDLEADSGDGIEIRVAHLGWRPTEELPDSFAVGALTMGCLMAKGAYQMWLCDDERMAVDHIESLVDLLESRKVDFVYPLVYMWKPGDPTGGWQVGSNPPMFGNVTSVLYRRRCLQYGMYRFMMPKVSEANPVPHDWDLVRRWVRNGATWAMLERETISHRADH